LKTMPQKSLSYRPLPSGGLGGMHRIQFAKRKNPKPDFSDFSVFRFFFDCLDTAKLLTNCKFCTIFVALIPVMNYYTQSVFKRGEQ
jgi:hypothetical protein